MIKAYLFNTLFLLLAITSCKSSKERNLNSQLETINSDCPSDGNCSFEVLKNKSLQIKQDDFGALYPVLEEGTSYVIKFEYQRDEIENTQDGHYSELIYVELPQNMQSIQLINDNLSTVKVLFARLCFCRGQTGYYKVTKGQLEITKNEDDTYNFMLQFQIDEVPQIITLIEASFRL
ncbi:hypothetical protein DI383_03370 [Flavobacteriaceae bacterium LYZ1037]|nr:hypothetical protein DI383_03370 [Flavobacteriaceae bacterium LYZ1037]